MMIFGFVVGWACGYLYAQWIAALYEPPYTATRDSETSNDVPVGSNGRSRA